MTTRIHVSDTGLAVIPPRDTLTQGSENTLTLEFEFSGAWLLCSEYNAVFTDDINSAAVPVTGGACVVPVEVLQNPWRFVTLSLNGTSASGVITSPFVRIGQVLPSASGGDGGKFVTMAQLMEILQGYVKAEDLGVYVTHDELQAAIATLATQADIAQLDEAKADKTQLADYETSAHAAATFAQKNDIADMLTKTEAHGLYADKASMLTLENTVEAQAARIGQAETNISTLQTDVAGKADASVLADYETTAHAATTYETKADASKIKSITAAGFAVTPDSAGDVNIGGTDVSRVSDSGSWGSEITYTISQTLPDGASSDTKGSSLTISKRTENSGATPRIIMRVDGVQLATSADIPDVSHFATTDYVQNTFESTQHASETYLKISDAASTYATQTAISDMATQTWVQQYIASLDGTNMQF